MKLIKVNYSDLNSKQKEIYNFQIAASYLAGYGFNCIKLSDDWQGADFLAYHKNGQETLKVQLKGRPHVEKKYVGKQLYMCFPVARHWYLVPHDDLLGIVSKSGKMQLTRSWQDNGMYNYPAPSKSLMEELRVFRLDPPDFETEQEI